MTHFFFVHIIYMLEEKAIEAVKYISLYSGHFIAISDFLTCTSPKIIV